MCYKDILICLVGNKIDLEDKREVSAEEGQNYAKEMCYKDILICLVGNKW